MVTTDEMLLLVGQLWWDRTYRVRPGDDAYAIAAVDHQERLDTGDAHPGLTEPDAAMAKWADSGYPKLVADHKYAAALCATKIERDFAGDIHLPGKSFVVAVPAGLLTVPFDDEEQNVERGDRGATRDYTRILVTQYTGRPVGASMILFDSCTCGGIRYSLFASSLDELLFGEIDQEESARQAELIGAAIPWDRQVNADKSRKERVTVLARRLVVGLLLAMNDTANFKTQNRVAKRGKRGERGTPAHRVVFVGKPIKVDCRPALEEYLGGRRGPPSVQTLVRGHHKRQVVGIGRNGRRIIWIEPYWRGPEDAPILARPLHVGPA